MAQCGCFHWLLSVIIVAFVFGNLLVLLSARRIQAANRRISQNAMVSIVDVSRIVHDIDLVRLFIDDHIFETTTEQMEPLERNIAKARGRSRSGRLRSTIV